MPAGRSLQPTHQSISRFFSAIIIYSLTQQMQVLWTTISCGRRRRLFLSWMNIIPKFCYKRTRALSQTRLLGPFDLSLWESTDRDETADERIRQVIKSNKGLLCRALSRSDVGGLLTSSTRIFAHLSLSVNPGSVES